MSRPSSHATSQSAAPTSSYSLPGFDDEEIQRLRDELGFDSGWERDSGFGALSTPRGRLPLVAMTVKAEIDGLLAEIRVEQWFHNVTDESLEATYIFPLPDRAGVSGFRMEVAGRVIEGQLDERGRARKNYDAAIRQGHRAAIAEEERSGVFTLRVGNLPPREAAKIQFTLSGPLSCDDGELTFWFPLVVAPRYIPGVPLPGPNVGDGVAADTDAVPDASRISPPVLLPGFPNPVRLAIELDVVGLSPEQASTLRSSLHAVRVEAGDGRTRIALLPSPDERLNRDFIVRYRLGGTQIKSTLAFHPDVRTGQRHDGDGDGDGTFALTLLPPKAEGAAAVRPRDVVFVLDRSGSMDGWKMVAARRALATMVETLTPDDRMAVLVFDTVIEQPPDLAQPLQRATDRQRFRVAEYLAGVEARGGTEMAPALLSAASRWTADHETARPLATVGKSAVGQNQERERVLVLVTDGQVGNEDQLLASLKVPLADARVFVLGIDQAVNAGFLNRLTNLGRPGGRCQLVESEDRLRQVLDSIHEQFGAPVLTDLRLEPRGWEIVAESMIPARGAAMFARTPLLVLGRYRGTPSSLEARGFDADESTWATTVTGDASTNPALTTAWARARVRQLEDHLAAAGSETRRDRTKLERSIVALSLAHHVLSRFTAFVAVDRAEKVNPGGRVLSVVQPVEPPAGWGQTAQPAAMRRTPSQAQPMEFFPASAPRMISRSKTSTDFDPLESFEPPRAPLPLSAANSSDEDTDSSHDFILDSYDDDTVEIGSCLSRPDEDDFDGMELSSPPPASPMVHLDRFDNPTQCGEGGMGKCYFAHDPISNNDVFIRELHGLIRGDDSARADRLAREFRLLVERHSRLRHPAIVPYLEVIDHRDEGTILLVAAAAGGESLESQLRGEGSLITPFEEAARLILTVAEALEEGHRHGLVHGGLNPSDVMVGEDGTPRLLDLGVAKVWLELEEGESRQMLGRPVYIAPELLTGTFSPTIAGDVYALGVIFYQLLTGRPPHDWKTGNFIDLIQKVLKIDPISPRQLNRLVPEELAAICLKALARDPAQRYASAQALLDDLRAFLASSSSSGG